MVVTATKIVEAPASVISQQKSVSGTLPTPPPAPPADTPLLIAEGEPTAAPTATEAPAAAPAATEVPAVPAKTNPTTGSYLPFIGLGVLLVIIFFVLAKFARGKSRT
jgi:hypothetical protein